MTERRYFPEDKHAALSSTNPNDFLPKVRKKVELWNITELYTFFEKAKVPEGPVKLGKGVTIINVRLFIESSLRTIKVHNGNKTFEPYYDRLLALKKIIEKK